MTLLKKKFGLVACLCFVLFVGDVSGLCRIYERCASRMLAFPPLDRGACGDGRVDVTALDTSCTSSSSTCGKITAGTCSTYTGAQVVVNGVTVGKLECLNEQCDDHNTESGDGCSSNCQLEGVTYAFDKVTNQYSFNATSHIDSYECIYPAGSDLATDDWIHFTYLSTPDLTAIHHGYKYATSNVNFLTNSTTCCYTRQCGNGVINCYYVDSSGGLHPEEMCDDSDQSSGDGCSASCEIEIGWDCYNGATQVAEPTVCHRIPNFITPTDEVTFLVEWYNQTFGWSSDDGWKRGFSAARSTDYVRCADLFLNGSAITCPMICNLTSIQNFPWRNSLNIDSNILGCTNSTLNLLQVSYGFESGISLATTSTAATLASVLANYTKTLRVSSAPTVSVQSFYTYNLSQSNDQTVAAANFTVFVFNVTFFSPADYGNLSAAITDPILDNLFSGYRVTSTPNYRGGNLFSVVAGCNQNDATLFYTYHKQLCDSCCMEACKDKTRLLNVANGVNGAYNSYIGNCTFMNTTNANQTLSLYDNSRSASVNVKFGRISRSHGVVPTLKIDYANVPDPCGYCRDDQSCPQWYGLTCGDCQYSNGTFASSCEVVFRNVTPTYTTPAGMVHVTGLFLGANGIRGKMGIPRDPNHMNSSQFRHLSSLTRLRRLYIPDNYLTIIGPTVNWTAMPVLESIDFSRNSLTSAAFLAGANILSNLFELLASGNKMQDQLPSSTFATTACLTSTSDSACSRTSALTTLNIQNNLLTGTIPWALSYAYSLVTLQLDGNQFDSLYGLTIPASILTLNLFNSSLQSSIPPTLFNCLSSTATTTSCGLITISFQSNNLTGSIPNTISNLNKAMYLDFSWNILTGTIPAAMGQLTNLRVLRLNNNRLTRTLPFSMGLMANLETLDLSSNTLTSPFPAGIFSSMESLLSLNISNNKFASFDGASVSSLRSLDILDVSYNSFSSLAGFEGLQNVQILMANNNNITTMLALSKMASLVEAYFQNNLITGQLPDSVFSANNNNLEILRLENNILSGSLPSTWIQMTSLRIFNGSYNNFQNDLPAAIGTLSSLMYLDLRSNKIKSQIPDDVGKLVVLLALHLENNLFYGQIPTSIGGLENVRELSLHDNALTGSIPTEIGLLTKLTTLDLSTNHLQSSIPREVVALPKLTTLNLLSNWLSGFLPDNLAQSSFALNLDSAGTFWCPFPTALKSMSFMTSSVKCSQCPEDFTASPVSYCTGTDFSSSLCNTCNSRGVCANATDVGTCACNSGWEGVACQKLSCASNCSYNVMDSLGVGNGTHGSCLNAVANIRCTSTSSGPVIDVSAIQTEATSQGTSFGGRTTTYTAEQVMFALAVASQSLTSLTASRTCVQTTNTSLSVCSQQMGSSFSGASTCFYQRIQLAYCECLTNEWEGLTCDTQSVSGVTVVNVWQGASSILPAPSPIILLFVAVMSAWAIRRYL